MNKTFTDLGVNPALSAGLLQAEISKPTAVQVQVIPEALEGKDIVAQSATGTGKTLAYLLPIFQRIDTTKRDIQAMILAPTHELAIQILRQVELLAKNSGLPVTSTSLIGNVNIMRQIDKLKEKPHIIVGSSGRIMELIQKKKIAAPTIKTIVIDEADRLLDENNFAGVRAVVQTTLKDRQIMLFSATITPKTLEQAQKMMNQPVLVDIPDSGDSRPDIEHFYFVAEQRDKIEVLRKLVFALEVDRALVFVNRGEDIEITVAKLNHHGLKAAGLHGSSFKTDRKQSLEDFRKGKAKLLVASDLAARGLDIPGVAFVFNLDLPEEPQVYLHRAGRTGRAGKKGTALCILNPREAALMGRFEKVLKLSIKAKTIAKGRLFDSHKKVEDYVKTPLKKTAAGDKAAAPERRLSAKPVQSGAGKPGDRPDWRPPATFVRPGAKAAVKPSERQSEAGEGKRPAGAKMAKPKSFAKSEGHSNLAPWAKPGTKPSGKSGNKKR
ncbi:DEAD/DEAH box helicase [Azotosporobacter soli]|uniref:DEAD/DEAH box helicase n=1 Tax=Azotosporobacter soli TaxID=3055040 RepID=UPI0031FF34EF